MSGLVLAFFSSVSDEMQTAKTYAAGASTKELADSAVHSVDGGDRRSHFAGAKRCMGVAAWNDTHLRRLRAEMLPAIRSRSTSYTLPNLMVVPAAQIGGFKLKDETPMDWDTKPALFTDLNSPVMVADPMQPANPPQAVFPILDPGAKGNVDGFDFTAAVHGAVAIGKTEDLRIPMPVRWMRMPGATARLRTG